MSSFSPSEQFEQRWLGSPMAMRKAIQGELSDIIVLLDEKTDLNTFNFQTPDLHTALYHLQTAHLDTLHQIRRQERAEQAQMLIPKFEQKIQEALDARIGSLSDELRAWIRESIKDELALLDDEL